MTYSWTRISGPAVTLSNPNSVQPTFTAPALAAGATYIFQLIVSDGEFSFADTVTITVRPFTITLTANPSPIDHAGTTALTGAFSHTTAGITQRWTASAGGTFSAQTALSTNWTSLSTVILATVVDFTLTVRLSGVVIATKTIQVVVRAQTSLPLALPAYADQTGATGNTVDLTIATATDGRAPYSYAYADLPEELGAIGRRIRGRLITPGVETVTVTVTDANGDTATSTFDWTVTGVAILPPAGINVRIDWGRLILRQRRGQRNEPHSLRDKLPPEAAPLIRQSLGARLRGYFHSSLIIRMAYTTWKTRIPCFTA